ncbi:MAG: DUF192 domain-containing protein [Anaerolineales bacterium]|nr:DUF192 domain-containing protein [Anaerolineales bacterium]
MAEKSHVSVINRTTGQVLIESARWCKSSLCKLRGLQFRLRLKPGEALILVYAEESVLSSSIHMFFVFFPIAAVWINNDGVVTSAQLAKPWRPYYASSEPARYVLETAPEFLDRISVGDELDFS